MLKKTEIVQALTEHRAVLQEKFTVKSLGLFGSAAREELREDSDVDVLVAFQGAPTFAAYWGLKQYLEGLLHKRVDLVTESGLKSRARAYVEKDLIRVA